MRKIYDFSNAKKNPYFKKIKLQGHQIAPDIVFELKDLVRILPKASSKKVRTVSDELIALEKRIAALEAKQSKSSKQTTKARSK